MTVSNVTQRLNVHFGASIQTLQSVLSHLSADVEVVDSDKKTFRIFSAIDVVVSNDKILTLEVYSHFK